MQVTATQTLSGGGVTFSGIKPSTTLVYLSLAAAKMSTSGSIRVRLGTASGLVSVNYDCVTQWLTATQGIHNSTVDFMMEYVSGAQHPGNGHLIFTSVDQKNYLWAYSGGFGLRLTGYNSVAAGRLSLGGQLTQLQVFPSTGTFTGGTANLITGG